MWLVGLQTAPKEAQVAWQQMQAANGQADRRMLVALHNNLPPSVRPLLGLQNMRDAVGKVRSTLDYWDEKIEALPAGSQQRAFMEAGKAYAVEQSRRVQ